ncbi:MAG: exodeoxyribonuclease VII large subunit [Deltaproteobacteria bacterium]|nr:exodeoxyribonuclease VII large subunit [Deltaproteobacteria bacterium]
MEEHPSFKELLKDKIYTVSEITARIKETIEEEIGFEYVWIVGEISNFKGNYASGHWYFSLKDKDTQISAVSFKWANQYIKFIPENGMEVICCGQISVYEKQGSYQINVRYIEPKGVGAQALALEQLKERLLAEGLFNEERKRPLPYLPRKIGIVTSPTGAAVKDILEILDRRFPNLEILISPTRVQGDEAPKEIVSALSKLYKIDEIELIILARGGGSKEDLWAFNDEGIAREIAKSPVPVISAVGHEIDITIADLVADVRAATPSMAAEIAVKEKSELKEGLSYLKEQIALALNNRIEVFAREVDQLQTEFVHYTQIRLDSSASELANLSGNLDALSPLKVLDRGYSITQKLPNMETIKNSKKLKKGDEVLINFHKGKAKCTVKETKN